MKYFIVFSLWCALLSGVVLAQKSYFFQTTQQSQHFDQIVRTIRCVVCLNENLVTSNASIAHNMRSEIYKMIIQGKTNKQIISHMQAQYRYFISFKPVHWVAYVLWLSPIVLFIITLIFGWFFYIRYLMREES